MWMASPHRGACRLSIKLNAPLEAGTYHYGACVEPVSGEASTGNNCSDAVQVEVVGRPDLVVEHPQSTTLARIPEGPSR